MDLHAHDWVNLLLRWMHLVAGISWIGSSFYFIWLDAHLEKPETPDPSVEGSLWLVHSGGFYRVERRRIAPGGMPKTLYWFKWPATLTWLSGFVLLSVLYYFTGGAYLIDPLVSPITAGQATALGIGFLVVSWFLYNAIFQSALGKTKAAPIVALALLVGAVYGLCHVLSGRAAYIHIGSMFGTLMVLNVWRHILPSQQQMIDATTRGETPDFTLSGHAKRRSVHNTYMTLPVLFIMLSNHYPMTYGHAQNWLVLLLLIVAGAAARHVMVSKDGKGRWALVPVGVGLLSAVFLVSTRESASVALASHERVSFKQVQTIVSQRCIACHASKPSDPTFGPAPGGVNFELPATIKALSARIKFRVVDTKTMPLMNKTAITEEERAAIGKWIDEGAKIDE